MISHCLRHHLKAKLRYKKSEKCWMQKRVSKALRPGKTRPSSPQRQVVARDLEPDHIPAHDSPECDVFALKGRRTEGQSRPTKQWEGKNDS